MKAADYVIAISVDGLGTSYLQSLIAEGRVPNFARLQRESAWTGNARTDFDYSTTLPNHTSMLTGRPVLNKFGSSTTGHLWTSNGEPGTATLHSNRGFYVSSVFDVVHDSGRRTGLFVGKSKLRLYDQSYNSVNGAAHPTYGRDKIDTYLFGPAASVTDSFISGTNASPYHFTLLHYAETDSTGHQFGWGSSQFRDAVVTVDTQLGRVFNLVETHPALRDRTTIILTADHGGTGTDHADPADPLSYTVPFFVWGAGVTRGVDLYALNAQSRADPGGGRPNYGTTNVPIRNGDLGNLSLAVLGLDAIAGSTINAGQDLAISALPGDANLDGIVNIVDLGIFAGNWQRSGVGWQGGDFTQTGKVEIADLGVLAGNWLAGVAPTGVEGAMGFSGAAGLPTLPEPAGAMGMLLIGFAAVLRRRRR